MFTNTCYQEGGGGWKEVFTNTCYQSISMFRREEEGGRRCLSTPVTRVIYSMFRREEGGWGGGGKVFISPPVTRVLFSMFGREKEEKGLLHGAFTDIKGVSSCQRWCGRCTLADIQ